MRIKKLEKKDYNEYELFVSKFSESLLYYSTKYKDFLEDLLDIESNYLMVVDESDNIQAVLPLMQKEGKFGTIINTLPYYGSNGGVIAKDNKARNILLNHYNELTNAVSGATYITNPLQENIENIESDIVDNRRSQWTPIDFTDNVKENIMASYHSKTRNLVRKAMKLNVEIKIDNEQFDFLYETHLDNLTLIGGKAKDKFFFKLVDKYFEKGEDYNIYVALLDGKKIGAVLLFYYNETVEYFTPAVVSEYRRYQPISLIVYKAMIEASNNNYKWWNWGGTWLTQDGVYHFKKRFGAVDKEYKYFIKIQNQEIYTSTKEELLEEYDNFYVVPFDRLETSR
jgi:hypothetical protein